MFPVVTFILIPLPQILVDYDVQSSRPTVRVMLALRVVASTHLLLAGVVAAEPGTTNGEVEMTKRSY